MCAVRGRTVIHALRWAEHMFDTGVVVDEGRKTLMPSTIAVRSFGSIRIQSS